MTEALKVTGSIPIDLAVFLPFQYQQVNVNLGNIPIPELNGLRFFEI